MNQTEGLAQRTIEDTLIIRCFLHFQKKPKN
jgi:hypothetical protein